MTLIVLVMNVLLIGLFFWGMIRTARRTPGPPPWPLRLVADTTGAPRFGFLYALMVTAVIGLIVASTITPTRAQQRQDQLDRIEQLLIELRRDLRQ